MKSQKAQASLLNRLAPVALLSIFAPYFSIMDRNALTGLLLIGLLLIGYTWYSAPSEDEIAAQKAAKEQAAIEADKSDEAAAAQPFATDANLSDPKNLAEVPSLDSTALSTLALQEQAMLSAKYGAFATASKGEEELITIKNEQFELTFSNKGGVPVAVRLLKYDAYNGDPLYLFREGNHSLGYRFVYPSLGEFKTSDFYFESPVVSKTEIIGDDELKLTYTLSTDDGRRLENIWTIQGDTYDVGFETRSYDMGGIITDAYLVWELAADHIEKSIDAERNNSTIFFKEVESGRDYLSETGEDDESLSSNFEWIAFKQNFFSLILMQPDPEQGGTAFAPFGKNTLFESRPFAEETGSDSLTQYYFAELPIGADMAFKARLFMGPNDYKTLRSYGMETDKIINLGWGIFGWVNMFLVIPIFDWLQGTGMSYGIIILILTVIIKMLLGPLTWKNYLSSAKMRVLKPEIDELNEKNKDADPMKKQQATMELYRKTGVSPFAGCLPMVVQLPILYAMFRFFPNAIQLRHEPFLWADDLSSYDSIATLPFSIPAYGDHVSLFTLLMAASTFIYTMFNSSNMPTTSQPGMPNMKVIMYIFPFMMIFFFNAFASSLSYYYFLANLTSILQMVFIKRFLIDEDKIRAKIAENKKKRGKLTKSKFQQKLENMAKQRGLNAK
jgi:YidC/Oxa1 family membrane protein insertase